MRHLLAYFAAMLLLGVLAAASTPSPDRSTTSSEAIARISSCWKPPPLARANPIDITVVVSFNRAGEILGHPRITYESEQANDNDRLQYRLAVMEALQRCTPMPFTESMAGAVAGRPFAIRFQNRKPSPQTPEKRAWLTPKTL